MNSRWPGSVHGYELFCVTYSTILSYYFALKCFPLLRFIDSDSAKVVPQIVT